MKKALFALSVLAMTGLADTADAREWCANYGREGRESCHFTSMRQCLAFVQGLGGTCRPSQYSGDWRRRGGNTYRRYYR
jgi:hypothetical protein